MSNSQSNLITPKTAYVEKDGDGYTATVHYASMDEFCEVNRDRMDVDPDDFNDDFDDCDYNDDDWMLDSYDFSKAIKNPYAERLKNGFSVTVEYDNLERLLKDNKDRVLVYADANTPSNVAEATPTYSP